MFSRFHFLVATMVAFSVSFAQATDLFVYDANLNPLVPLKGRGGLVLKNGKKTGRGILHTPDDAKAANSTLRTILDFYQTQLNRNSYDNKGTAVEASVNVGSIDIFGMKQNAAWTGLGLRLFIFGKGGNLLNDFTQAMDVVAHEFTHAVIETTSNLDYNGQSGALNESFADIMGETVQILTRGTSPGNDLVVGESVISDKMKFEYEIKTGKKLRGLRDMLNPELGLEPQPSHMSQIPSSLQNCTPNAFNDRCGVHILSGIPNKAAALIIKNLGAERTKKLFYVVMTEKLQSRSQFVDFAQELRREAQLTLTSTEAQVVNSALLEVGL